MDTGQTTTNLQQVGVGLVSDAQCSEDYKDLPFYGDRYQPTVELCAGDTVAGGHDACQGDQRGPLVNRNAPGADDDGFVGIVSWGIGCGEAAYPGVYSEVADPGIRAFVSGFPMPRAGERSAPTLSGAAAIGQRLTRSPGVWTARPARVSVRAVDGRGRRRCCRFRFVARVHGHLPKTWDRAALRGDGDHIGWIRVARERSN
jgi:hypothetical protein